MSRIVRRTTVAPRYAGRPPAIARVTRGERGDQVAKIGKEMREALSGTMRDVMLAAAASVEAQSPVDTGHMQSNFVLSTGRPYGGVDGSRESVSRAAQDAGRAKMAKYDIGRDGPRVFLTNNVHYFKYHQGFFTEALMAGVQSAPRGMKLRSRKLLKSVARSALRRGA
jgi:hypothetical protein